MKGLLQISRGVGKEGWGNKEARKGKGAGVIRIYTIITFPKAYC